ncbi:MAG: TIGR01459 family HAD-type hydrolase [Proteobacteria bacterium]|nr:TIGR01459 family HAD-type hydrolase [Pseudomonadota bacterium]
MTIELLPGLAAVADDYDGFILDVWGVLYDGGAAFPGVVTCLEELRRRGKRIVVLSNSPRRAALVRTRLSDIGIAPSLYDSVHTSGEETHRHLATRPDAWYRALGRRFVDTGDPRPGDITAGTDARRVERVEEAEFVLATMAREDANDVHLYQDFLRQAAERSLPMICANPDLTVIHGSRVTLCGGSLAQAYEAAGGRVRYHGKPYREIYDFCFALMGSSDRRRILAVGDGLLTDIPGAREAGIDALLVLAGLPSLELGREPDAEAVDRLCRAHGETPLAAIDSLRW